MLKEIGFCALTDSAPNRAKWSLRLQDYVLGIMCVITLEKTLRHKLHFRYVDPQDSRKQILLGPREECGWGQWRMGGKSHMTQTHCSVPSAGFYFLVLSPLTPVNVLKKTSSFYQSPTRGNKLP